MRLVVHLRNWYEIWTQTGMTSRKNILFKKLQIEITYLNTKLAEILVISFSKILVQVIRLKM